MAHLSLHARDGDPKWEAASVSGFAGVEGVWADRLDTLRNVVRQHVIAEQLHAHVEGVRTALDVGCGQGTQAVRLARRGVRVTGVDPSAGLLRQLSDHAAAAGCTIEALAGDLESLAATVESRRFDLVCAHGLLMYLSDAQAGLAALADRLDERGLLSFTFRNGDALAFRPGVRGEWAQTLRAFDADTYVNELGARARATRLETALTWCADLGLEVEEWYGVRVFTDGRTVEELPDPASLADCLAAEVEAGRRDPYRRIASQIHVVARRL